MLSSCKVTGIDRMKRAALPAPVTIHDLCKGKWNH